MENSGFVVLCFCYTTISCLYPHPIPPEPLRYTAATHQLPVLRSCTPAPLPTCPTFSFPFTSRQIDGETVTDFIFGGLQNYCSHKIKRRLLLGRKVMSNLDSLLKSRDITLSTKVHLVKAMVFPVVMYGCERWTIKKAEH